MDPGEMRTFVGGSGTAYKQQSSFIASGSKNALAYYTMVLRAKV